MNVQKVKYVRAFSPESEAFIKPLPLRFKDLCRREGSIIVREDTDPRLIHTGIIETLVHAQDLCRFKPDKIPLL